MAKFSFSPSLSWDTTSAVRYGMYALGKIALLGAVAICVITGDLWRKSTQIDLPTLIAPTEQPDDKPQTSRERSEYQVIESRNLFGATKVAPDKPTTLPITPLKLHLLGTNITSGTRPLAIIEDTAARKEDVFELGEIVHKQAKLIEVLPDRVKLDHNGKVEVLLLDENDKGAPATSTEATSDDSQTEFVVQEAELAEALSNLPQLMNQARAVPFFRNGQSIGMRLFAIRRGSLYEKVGLKNGDIVKVINNTSIADPAQAIKLFEDLKNERSITVTIERDQVERQLNYSIR